MRVAPASWRPPANSPSAQPSKKPSAMRAYARVYGCMCLGVGMCGVCVFMYDMTVYAQDTPPVRLNLTMWGVMWENSVIQSALGWLN